MRVKDLPLIAVGLAGGVLSGFLLFGGSDTEVQKCRKANGHDIVFGSLNSNECLTVEHTESGDLRASILPNTQCRSLVETYRHPPVGMGCSILQK